jgi:hypothetical protein
MTSDAGAAEAAAVASARIMTMLRHSARNLFMLKYLLLK